VIAATVREKLGRYVELESMCILGVIWERGGVRSHMGDDIRIQVLIQVADKLNHFTNVYVSLYEETK
jgi:hypothetical protein